MGVDFFNCASCRVIVCDAGPYTFCEQCGRSFCVNCHSGYEEYDEENDKLINTDCPICNNKVITDNDLLKFALKKLKLSRKKLEEIYRENNK